MASEFYDLLADTRSELGRLASSERRKVRENLVVDSAVMMHGYAALMKDYNAELGKLGSGRARRNGSGVSADFRESAHTNSGAGREIFSPNPILYGRVSAL